jgi:hypothetical protein
MTQAKPLLIVNTDNQVASSWLTFSVSSIRACDFLDLSEGPASFSEQVVRLQPYLQTHHLVFVKTQYNEALAYYCYGQQGTDEPHLHLSLDGLKGEMPTLNLVALAALGAIPYTECSKPMACQRGDWAIAVGAGVAADLWPEVAALAAYYQAPIFGTAPVVDQGLLPESQLLGVSGQTIRPKYLLCLGLSGAMGHLLGIGEGTTVFAINQDPKAAIFRHAHVHWVIDIKLALGHISSWLKQVTVSASAALTT